MKKHEWPHSRLVYSTQSGRVCPGCRRPVAECVCEKKVVPATPAAPVRVRRETSGRGGKCVTVIMDLPLDEDGLVRVSKQLKAACGTGGTLKDGRIEVQGDFCDRVIALLAAQGWRAKRAGG